VGDGLRPYLPQKPIFIASKTLVTYKNRILNLQIAKPMDFNNLNMADMFGRMADMQQKMKEAQENLEKQTTTAEAGGGMVKVTVNGKMQVTSVKIEKEVVDPNDVELLEDLIVAGVNKALADAGERAKDAMQQAAGLPTGLDLNNLDLGKFGF